MRPLLPLLLAGCTAAPADTADTGDTGPAAPDTAETADTADTDTADTDTPDTDTAPTSNGLLHFVGAATVLDAYAGTETVVFVGEEGAGEELCRVTLTLASTEARADCLECDWAFTVEVVDAVTEVDAACDAVGWAEPAAAIGTTRGYGYVALYFGHAPVLMVESGGAWDAGAYADYDPETGALAYDREDGFFPY